MMTNNSDNNSAFPDNIASDAAFAFCNGETMSYARFWQHVHYFSTLLPSDQYFINFCEDRYLFSVALFSTALKGAITLLPPSKTRGITDELKREYGLVSAISDQPLSGFSIAQLLIDYELLAQSDDIVNRPWGSNVFVEFQQLKVVAFTSGSTGRPQPQIKQWSELVDCATCAIQHLGLSHRQYAMLSTTPPQHMFGLETSVIWPYHSHLVMTNQRPFYPEDIRLAVQSMPYPVVLCSTPTHLRACISNQGDWSNLTAVISSTSPLSTVLATEVETILGCKLYELYGSTETLSFASRRTAKQSTWTPYSGVVLESLLEQTQISATYLPHAVKLDDIFAIQSNGQFNVIGRSNDLIKIGGKRSSIAELNQRLHAIPGIVDGCFFRIEHAGSTQRLGVLVVSKNNPDVIISELKRHLDEVFLPRSVYYVEAIPRNLSGKIIHTELEKMIKLEQELLKS